MDDIDCKKLVADLAVQFYDQGWFPGSGGSLTIRKGKKRRGVGGSTVLYILLHKFFFKQQTVQNQMIILQLKLFLLQVLRKLLAVQTSNCFYLHVNLQLFQLLFSRLSDNCFTCFFTSFQTTNYFFFSVCTLNLLDNCFNF